ncbi:MAG: HK97 family phage prohead protease [Acidobacteria bacterium]|nr:HK97 family phage prohead protease [Acidobacteriota bacterium]
MLERRFAPFRVAQRTLSGVALRYGDVATVNGQRERFEPRAFGAALPALALTLQHDPGVVLVPADGLALADTDRELHVRADLPAGSAVIQLVERGALHGFSVEFRSVRERREADVRVIEAAELAGLSLVDRGAYPASRPEVRADGPESAVTPLWLL